MRFDPRCSRGAESIVFRAHDSLIIKCATGVRLKALAIERCFPPVRARAMSAAGRCKGFVDNGSVVECCFSLRARGAPASGKYGGQCQWCSPERLRAAYNDGRSRRAVARCLTIFKGLDEDVFKRASARLQAVTGGEEVVELSEKKTRGLQLCQPPSDRALVAKVAEETPSWFASPSVLAAAARVLAEPYVPQPEGPILILKKIYWDRMASGEKSLEIRRQSLKPMRRHVGHSGEIWGTIQLGQAVRVVTKEKWVALTPYHHWATGDLPYKATYAHPIFKVEIFKSPVRYMTLPGQVNNAKYRPVLGTAESTSGVAVGEEVNISEGVDGDVGEDDAEPGMALTETDDGVSTGAISRAAKLRRTS